jgi:hypothetical protein
VAIIQVSVADTVVGEDTNGGAATEAFAIRNKRQIRLELGVSLTFRTEFAKGRIMRGSADVVA